MNQARIDPSLIGSGLPCSLALIALAISYNYRLEDYTEISKTLDLSFKVCTCK
jgi:hypothetical protein